MIIVSKIIEPCSPSIHDLPTVAMPQVEKKETVATTWAESTFKDTEAVECSVRV